MLVIFFIFMILVIAFFIMPLNILLQVHRTGEFNKICLYIKILTFYIYKTELNIILDDGFYPRLKVRGSRGSKIGIFSKIFKKIFNIDEVKIIFKNYKEFISNYRDAYEYFLSKLNIKISDFKVYYGFENAYITGILNGILFIILSFFMILLKDLKNNIEIKNIYISPNFCLKNFTIYMNCIITIRIGYAIISSLILIKTFLFMEVKKIGKSSNSIANENYYGEFKRNG